MHKLFLYTFLLAIFINNSTAFASPYIKLSSGASIVPIKDEKDENYDYCSKIKQEEPTGFGEVSFGYNISDKNRVELAFGYLAPEHTQTAYVHDYFNDGSPRKVDGNLKIKATISTTMLKSYVDFLEVGMFKTFFGAGIGASRIEQTVSDKYKITNKITGTYINESPPARKASANNIAYTIILGASLTLHKSVILEGSYNFMDSGKVQHRKDLEHEALETHYKSHNVALGVRFNIN